MSVIEARAYLRLGYCHPTKLASEGCERCEKRTQAMRTLIEEACDRGAKWALDEDDVRSADAVFESIARELTP